MNEEVIYLIGEVVARVKVRAHWINESDNFMQVIAFSLFSLSLPPSLSPSLSLSLSLSPSLSLFDLLWNKNFFVIAWRSYNNYVGRSHKKTGLRERVINSTKLGHL